VHALAVLAHFHAHALVASSWPALRVPTSLLALAASPQLAWRLPALTALRSLPAALWTDAQLSALVRASVAALALAVPAPTAAATPSVAPVALAAALLLVHLTAAVYAPLSLSSLSAPLRAHLCRLASPAALVELRALLPLSRVLDVLAAVVAAPPLAHALLVLADRLAQDELVPEPFSVAALDTLARVLSSPALAVRLACLTLLARALTPARALHVSGSRLCAALASTLLEEHDVAALQLTCAVVALLASARAPLPLPSPLSASSRAHAHAHRCSGPLGRAHRERRAARARRRARE